jgi:xylulokinase
MESILVVDIGQDRCRTSYVDRDGNVLAYGENEYLTGKLGDWVEQEPRDWWLMLTLAFNQLHEKAPDVIPTVIALTGQTRIVLLMGADDRLDAAIMPEDRRATLEWQFMVQQLGVESLLRSANIVHEDTSPVAKLLWLKKHQSGMYAGAQTIFLGAHDYLAFRLCGARVTDYTTASATDLFSLQADTWAFDLLQNLDVRTDWLPTLVAPGDVVGQLSEDAAFKLGLPAGIPVMHGVADYIATMVGAGVGEPNQFACYLGDSGWLGAMGMHELADPITGLLNLREPERAQLAVVGPMITAGGCFDWLKDRFGSAEEKVFAEEKLPLTELMMTLAAEASPGSGGVIFLPYLAGEQAPFRDPNARGGWFHVTRKTWRSDLYRAVLEGVAYSMRAIHMLMPNGTPEGEEDGPEQNITLRLIGTEDCSPLWAQIFSDVFGCNLDLLSPADDVTARGVSYIAGKALGWYTEDVPNYEYIRSTGTYTPNLTNVEIYEKMFGVYCKLYPALHSSFNEMMDKKL